MGFAVEHFIELRILIVELRAHARVVVPVRLDELKSNLKRRDNCDVIAKLMAYCAFFVLKRQHEITVHKVRVAIRRVLKPRCIESDVA